MPFYTYYKALGPAAVYKAHVYFRMDDITLSYFFSLHSRHVGSTRHPLPLLPPSIPHPRQKGCRPCPGRRAPPCPRPPGLCLRRRPPPLPDPCKGQDYQPPSPPSRWSAAGSRPSSPYRSIGNRPPPPCTRQIPPLTVLLACILKLSGTAVAPPCAACPGRPVAVRRLCSGRRPPVRFPAPAGPSLARRLLLAYSRCRVESFAPQLTGSLQRRRSAARRQPAPARARPGLREPRRGSSHNNFAAAVDEVAGCIVLLQSTRLHSLDPAPASSAGRARGPPPGRMGREEEDVKWSSAGRKGGEEGMTSGTHV
ncbi:unnamed protein product [Urochloa humidicola]